MDMVASSNRVINSFPPLNNITPFNRVDGWSFLEVLEGLRNYIVNILVPEIDDDFKLITDQLNTWFEQYTKDFQGLKDEWQKLFDDFMNDIVAQLEALNDQAMANLIRDIQSKTREALNEEFYNRNIPVDNNVLGYRKSIKHNLPLQFPGFDNYVDLWGREIVPQSFCVDTVARELFVVYNGPSIVVAVYNWDTSAFKAVFQLGDHNTTVTEGCEIIREGLARYLYIRTGVGTMSRFNLTQLPSNGSSVNPSADYPIVGHGRTYSYDGRFWYVSDSSQRNVIRRLDEGFANNGYVQIPLNLAGWTGALDNPMSAVTPKIQGFAVTRAGLFTGHGGYHQVGSTVTPYAMQGVREFNLHGDLLGEYLVDTNKMAQAIFDSGQLQYMPRVFENEGIINVEDELYTLSFTHGYNASEAEIASKEGVLILKEFSTDNNAIDFAEYAQNPLVADNSLIGFVKNVRNYIVNQVTGEDITTLVDLVKYMANIGQQTGEYYSSTTNIVDTTGSRIPNGHMVRVSMGTETNFIIDVIGVDSHSRRLYQSNGVWIENRLVTPGAIELPITLAGASAVYSPSYRRENTEVALDGGVLLGDLPVGVTTWHKVANLPDGFRPAKFQYYPTSFSGAAAGNACYVRVQTNGDIEISRAATTATAVMLTGVRFRSTVVIE